MALSALAIRRPVTTMMFYSGLVLAGIVCFRQLSIDFLPPVSVPRMTVQVLCPGLSPPEIDENVAQPVAAAMAGVHGITKTSSASRRGMAMIMLEFSWGIGMDYAMLEVREKLDQLVPGLPERVERPTILRVDPEAEPIMTIAVTPDTLPGAKNAAGLLALTEGCHAFLQKRLEQVEGVAQVTVVGGVEREVLVEVNESKLTSLGLTLEELTRSIGLENVSTPGGSIMYGALRFPLRISGELRSVQEIAGLSLRVGAAGRRVSLSDVASLRDTIHDRNGWARYNGEEILLLEIRKEAGSNTLAVSQNIRRALERLEIEGRGLRLHVLNDQAEFIRASVTDVEQSILWGAALALLSLYLFLRRVRDTLVVGVSLPVSILATLIAMSAFGITLNVISLTGLAVGIGMLGDNAIIVVENVRRLRDEGMGLREAAVAGSREINLAVTASTMTNVAVFLPVLFVEGMAQQLFADMAVTMAVALLASLLVAVTLVPVLLAQEQSATSPGLWRLPGLTRVQEALNARGKQWLDRTVCLALRNRGEVLISTILLLALSGLAALLIPSESAPMIERKSFVVDVALRGNPSGEALSLLAQQIEGQLKQVRGVEGLFTVAGLAARTDVWSSHEPSAGRIQIRAQVADGMESREVMAVARERVRALCDGLAGVELFIQPAGTTFERILRPGTSDIIVRILGEDGSVRERIAEEFRRRIAHVPGLADVSSPSSEGEQEYRLHLNRVASERYGITPRDVAEHISLRTGGAVGTTLSLIGREVAVRIRPGASGSQTLDDLLASCITRGDTRVPLSLLVHCEAAIWQAEVRREDGTHALVIAGNASGRSIGTVAADLRQAAASFSLPPGYGISIGGENEQMESSFRALGIVIALSLLLVYMILAAEYESLLYPFVIILTSPLAFSGAVLAMLIAGERYNVMSLVGIAIMIGAVDNDAVIAVDVITALRRQGMPLHLAVRRGLQQRLRAILMTTMTTVLGVLPLVASFGEGSELVRALAIPLAGGLITSTVATLILIPVVYTYIDPIAARRL